MGKLTNRICNEGKCTYKLSPGIYNIVAYKEGFESASINVQISRGKEMQWKPDFSYMPKIENKNTLNHIILAETESEYEQNLDEVTLILDKNYNLTSLPSSFHSLNFSYSGKYALVTSKAGYYLYDVIKNEKEKFTSNKIKSLKWSKLDNLFYIEEAKTNKNSNNTQNILKKSSPKQEIENIVIFQKAFDEARIFIDAKENFLILNDINENDFYLIDIKQKTRHKINFPQNGELKFLEFINSDLAILSIDHSLFSFDISEEKFEALEAQKTKEIFALSENEALLILDNSEELSEDGSFVAKTTLNSFQIKYPSKLSQIEFAIYNLKEKTLVEKEVELEKALLIDRFDVNNEKFYFSSEEELFEIELEEGKVEN